MIITLEEAKNYLRIDFEDDDSYINMLIEQAESYLKDCIDNFDTKMQVERFQKKAKLCSMVIVQNMYDERSFSTKDNEKLRYIVASMLMQMNYCTYE
ncbi:head-tail connector protein [Clostridium senegalense]